MYNLRYKLTITYILPKSSLTSPKYYHIKFTCNLHIALNKHLTNFGLNSTCLVAQNH
jgi:hypothetical protein